MRTQLSQLERGVPEVECGGANAVIAEAKLGIIFTGWKAKFVAGLPIGAEFETRRLMKVQPRPGDDLFEPESISFIEDPVASGWQAEIGPEPCFVLWQNIRPGKQQPVRVQCPYRAAEIRYVKEAWQYVGEDGYPIKIPDGLTYAQAAKNYGSRGSVIFAADIDHCGQCPAALTEGTVWVTPKDRWRSPRFMPRWASRAAVEILATRIERVQEITFEGARAEGLDVQPPRQMLLFGADLATRKRIYDIHGQIDYEPVWNALNRKDPWHKNPFVHVIRARRVA